MTSLTTKFELKSKFNGSVEIHESCDLCADINSNVEILTSWILQIVTYILPTFR